MRYSWKKSVALTALICSAMSVSGCRAVLRLVAGAAQSSGGTPMNHYIDAYNNLIDDPTDDAIKCLKAFPGDGPKPGKALRSTLALNFGPRELDEVKASLEKADDEDEELQAALQDAHTQLEIVSKSCTEMKSYYDSEGFKDDADGTKIKGLFDKALTAFKASRESLKKADVKLQAFSDEQAKKDLEEYDEGTFSYHFRHTLIAANQVLIAAKVEDAEKFQSATQAYVEANKKLQETKEPAGDAFQRHATEFGSLAEKYQRAIKEDKAKGLERLAKDGKELVQTYNTLISLSDSMRKIEAAGGFKD